MTRTRRPGVWLLGPLAVVLMMLLATSGAGAAEPVAGSQGTDTSLPATASQVTVNGRGAFTDLAITVNQTASLTNQAVSITWTGGEPTRAGPGRFGSRYLQIMQCWGEDDGSVAGNPGPPPEQCEQGAVGGTFGGLPGSLYPAGFALSRIISRSDWPNFDSAIGHLDTRTTNVWLPFRAVDGTVVNIETDPTFNPAIVGGNFWLNPFFNLITTNEIAGAVTGPDGTGAELFQVLTGVQSSGLGCGQRTQPVAGGAKEIPKCWIVVVPRGAPVDENAGTPFEVAADESGVVTSPVAPAAWQHRISIPIDFNPVDSPCALGADERRISGSELALPAVASWQPSLCAGGDRPPYSYAPVSDTSARQQLVSGQPGAPGMAIVSQPLSADSVDPDNPVVYAPISASGIVIGFNIERNPLFDAPNEERRLAGVRVAELNLTPRLVAKLLTQSYRQAVSIVEVPDYPWLATNPAHMGLDPEFRRFNPEFDLLQIAEARTFSGLQLPAGSSDAAQHVWRWVFADPEASAWLRGTPDEWGMRVNPVFATDATANATGIAFGDPVPNSFPKSDSYCYRAPARGPGRSVVPPPLCGTDWLPYSRGFADAAKITRVASDGARIVDNPFALTASDVWKRAEPQYLGTRDMLSITDTPSAAQFGLQSARLSRAGDNGLDRAFVAPDAAGLVAGVASMTAGDEPSVLEPNPTAVAPDAYPLTALTYAAVAPLSLDEVARSEYAAFIDYAAGPGQVPGLELGQLPRGYTPLSDGLQAQARTTAGVVRTLVAAPTETVVPTTEAATTTTTSVPSPNTTTAAEPSSVAEPSAPVVDERVTPSASPSTPTFTSRGTAPTPVSTAPSSPAPLSPAPPASVLPATVEVATTATPPSTTVAPTTTTPSIQSEQSPVTTSPPVITPITRLARSRYALAGLGIAALGSALGAMEISRRPRRQLAGASDDGADPGEAARG